MYLTCTRHFNVHDMYSTFQCTRQCTRHVYATCTRHAHDMSMYTTYTHNAHTGHTHDTHTAQYLVRSPGVVPQWSALQLRTPLLLLLFILLLLLLPLRILPYYYIATSLQLTTLNNSCSAKYTQAHNTYLTSSACRVCVNRSQKFINIGTLWVSNIIFMVY